MGNMYNLISTATHLQQQNNFAGQSADNDVRKRCTIPPLQASLLQPNHTASFNQNLIHMQMPFTTKTSNPLTGLNKWLICLTMLTLAIVLPFSKAMSQANLYSWATSTGVSLETISSPTVVSTVTSGTVDDGSNLVAPAGFTFVYNQISYTQFTVGTNGYVQMGNTANTSILSTLSTAAINGVFVFGRDGNLNNVNAGSLTHGTAAGGKYVFQFVKFCGASGGGTSAAIVADVQVVLWGSTSASPGKIEIIWGASLGTPATSGAMGIVDIGNTFVNGTDGNKVTATNPTAWPVSGTKYTFTPPPPCAAPVDQATSLADWYYYFLYYSGFIHCCG